MQILAGASVVKGDKVLILKQDKGIVQTLIAYNPSGKTNLVVIYYAELVDNDAQIKLNNESSEFLWADIEKIEKLEFRESFLKGVLLKSLIKEIAPLESFLFLNFEDEH